MSEEAKTPIVPWLWAEITAPWVLAGADTLVRLDELFDVPDDIQRGIDEAERGEGEYFDP